MANIGKVNNSVMEQLKELTQKTSRSQKLQKQLDLQTMDWMKLLVAQLKNQDMYNQMDTNEMTQQMAQYSQIQAVQEMVSMQENMFKTYNTAYAASLIGKEVTAAEVKVVQTTNGKTEDKLITTKGKVTGVTLFDGEPYVYIGEKKFKLGQIMIVGEVPNNIGKETTPKAGGEAPPATEGTKPATGTAKDPNANNATTGNTNTETSAGTAETTQP